MLRFLFGDDIFISYSRRDGANYAAALANELSKPGRDFSCFLDQWGASAANELSKPVLRAIKRSSVLVLIGTRGAAASHMVRQEIEMFSRRRWLRAHRPVLPINIDGAFNEVAWAQLTGLHRTAETEEAGAGGTPSESVVRLIANSHSYTRRNQRARWLSLGAAALLVASVVTGGLAAWQRRLARDAEVRAATAAQRAAIANENRVKAEADTAEAQRLERIANGNRAKAETDMKEAQKQMAVAEAAVARQLKLSSSLQLANQSVSTRGESARSLELSALLGAESLRIRRTLEGDRAIRMSLDLLPKLAQTVSLPATASNESFTASSDGKYFGVGLPDKLIHVSEVIGGKLLGAFPDECSCLTAVAMEGKTVARVSNERAQLWVWGEGRYRKVADLRLNYQSVFHQIALSPDARYLIAINNSSDDGFHVLWKIDNGKLEQLDDSLGGFTDGAREVSFSPDAKSLLMTGVDRRDDSSRYMKTVAYALPDPGADAALGDRSADCGRSQFSEIITVSGQFDRAYNTIYKVAVSPTLETFGFHIALAHDDTTSVMLCQSLRTNCEEAARIPVKGDDITALVFSPDGKQLSIFGKEKNAVDVWNIPAYQGMPHRGYVETIAIDNQKLVTAAPNYTESGMEEAVKLLDLPANKELGLVPDNYEGAIVALSPDAKSLLAKKEAGDGLSIWDLTTGKMVSDANLDAGYGGTVALAISPARKYVAAVEGSNGAAVLRLLQMTGQGYKPVQSKRFSKSVNSVSFSPDGRYLALFEREFIGNASRVYILKVANLETAADLLFDEPIQVAALSSGGAYLATADGTTTKIWEVSTKSQISTIEERLPVRAAAFRRDGKFIAVASGKDTAMPLPINYSRVIPFEPGELVKEARSRLYRLNVTKAECRRYLGNNLPHSYCQSLSVK